MNFTREKIETSGEQEILTGCIVSTSFLGHMAPLLKDLNIIEEPHIRTIIRWCLDHYQEHNEAPGELIQSIFSSKSREIDAERSEIIESVLLNVNARYIENPKTFSESYYIKKAHTYVEEKSLLKLAENIKGFISTGKVEQAKNLLTTFNKTDKILTSGIDPFSDVNLIYRMFEKINSGIFSFPYPALDRLFKDIFKGDVLAVAGPAKKGKSFLMQQLGLFALYNRLNVALFSYEMEDIILDMRLFQSLMGESRRPMEEEIEVPFFSKEGYIETKYIKKNGLEISELLEFQENFKKYNKIGELRLYDHNHCGRKISDICSALDHLEKYEGVKADVVIIDYDKLLESETNFNGGPYEAINDIWKDTKSKIAQDRDTVVILGSQYNKLGAKGEVGPEEASGSSRKFDYVSHWISILQTEAEKKAGLMRLNVVGRHDEFHSSDKVVCLQSLALARPIMDARWQSEIPNYDTVVDSYDKIIKKENKDRVTEEEPVVNW